jgi:hypothetical protein
MGNDTDLRDIPELVRDLWDDPRRNELESAIAAVVHLATFDLDYFGYLFVQTWDFLEAKLGDSKAEWKYSLWYGQSAPVKVKDFPVGEDDGIPFVAAATAVEEHLKYVSEYMEEHNDLP